jgi:dephospho-CoA kinase
VKLIIGLVGEKGSGKETFGIILKELALPLEVSRIRFSDLLKETLNLWDIPITRENLQNLAVLLDKGFGDGTLSHAIFQRISKINADIILLDGVRWETDVAMLNKFPNPLLVYVTADLKVRYERLKNRGEKTGEETTSFEQFLKEEGAENELLIPKIGAVSDAILENNGTLEEFREKVGAFYQKSMSKLSSEDKI